MTSTSGKHRRWWVWVPLLGAGGWLALFGDNSPAGDAEVVQPTRPPLPAAASAGEPAAAPALLALLPREQLYPSPAAGGDATPPTQRDLFSTRSWNPPPPPPPPPSPPAPPVAPPLPYTVIGKKQEAGAWEVYLTRSDQTFVAREGQVLEGTWRVDAIQPPNLSATYLPLGLPQSLPIGDTR
jgi:hypothetical protein